MIDSGFPQGSVRGPILFLIYVDDVARDVDCEVAMFADDMKIWSVIRGPADEDRLQMNLNRLEEWSNRWLLRFNVAKCSILRLGNTARSASTRGYFLGGAALQEAEAQRDLGVLTTSSLKPSAHCSRVAKWAMSVLMKQFCDMGSFSSVGEALDHGNSLTRSALVKLYDGQNSTAPGNNCAAQIELEIIPRAPQTVAIIKSCDSLPLTALPCLTSVRPAASSTISSEVKVNSSTEDIPRFSGGAYELVLLVDIRENFGLNKMKEMLRSDLSSVSIGCEVRSLPVGDFVWVARPLSDMNALTPFKEVVLGIVIERKRADDLASSIVDGRFLEQKSRMQKLGFKRIYLFEECPGMRNLHISYETLLQSLINAQLIDGCEAVTFSNGSQCAEYLAALSRNFLSKAVFDLTVYCGGRKPNSPNLDRLWGIPWDEFASKSKKSPVLSLQEEFGRHLLQIHTMTGPKAANILSAYPTPISLFKAFAANLDDDWRKQLLSKQFSRSLNGNLGELVYHIYNTL
nr:unnamed protein product [Spirometra erinaceieuropaei]